MASFVLPEVNDDPEGWGPASNSVPEHLKYLVRPCCRAGAPPSPGRPACPRRPRVPRPADAGGGAAPRSQRARAREAMSADGVSCVRLPLVQPFAPFSKSDRVGRACEWNFTRDRERFRRDWQRYDRAGEPSPFAMEQVCVSARVQCVRTAGSARERQGAI